VLRAELHQILGQIALAQIASFSIGDFAGAARTSERCAGIFFRAYCNYQFAMSWAATAAGFSTYVATTTTDVAPQTDPSVTSVLPGSATQAFLGLSYLGVDLGEYDSGGTFHSAWEGLSSPFDGLLSQLSSGNENFGNGVRNGALGAINSYASGVRIAAGVSSASIGAGLVTATVGGIIGSAGAAEGAAAIQTPYALEVQSASAEAQAALDAAQNGATLVPRRRRKLR
jgi:hypothetical protein